MRDDFSGACPWSTDDNQDVRLNCGSGEYHVLLRAVDRTPLHVIPRRLEGSVAGVAVESDVTLEKFEGDADDFLMYGLGCWASRPFEGGQGYLFVLRPGALAILEQNEKDQRLKDQLHLQAFRDERSELVPEAGQTTRLRGECRSRDGRAELTLIVNGREAATAGDSGGFQLFNGVGFFIASSVPGTEIRYDNFQAEELSSGE